MVEFFQLLASNTPSNEGPDGLRWKGCKDGIFTSRSFYHVLNVRPGVPFPWKVIWAAKAPPRVSSLFGQKLGGRFLLVIILCGEGTQWLIDVGCVAPMGRQSIISYYTAQFHICYGAFFSVHFMVIGLFRRV